ncbi:MAG: flagellar type III secretion system pore protein FliP [Candidatus Tectomicrobia bacterium]|uniref:Flagellar biosynthetic protein FliP n=1 Tax=Tectimicrobiota bacterium TaxID=2528274 RepID=A0A932M0L3_UNCTE|nr:flagellar type III secretion system pore protein FliP [Candidatus Tectomicrobia bacterium]
MDRTLTIPVLTGTFLFSTEPAAAAQETVKIPNLTISLGSSGDPSQLVSGIQILLLLTVLATAPALLMMVTSFTRVVVVLSFVRRAIGTQTTPPNQVLIALSLFLTVFIMSPVWQAMNRNALQPYMAQQIGQGEAFRRAIVPLRSFMLAQTREKDLSLFVEMAKIERPRNAEDVPTHVLIPAFAISELRTSFEIGFLIYVPFLILDMVIASVLMSMGMLMLPPIVISLPFKLLLFVLVDGWYLVVGSLVKSFA